MDAEDLLMREFLGIRTAAETASAARWIRSRQRGDGTWSNWFGGSADLSTTVEAYVALRLAGDPPEAAHMARITRVLSGNGAVSRQLASSPASGLRFSANGPGRICRSCHRS